MFLLFLKGNEELTTKIDAFFPVVLDTNKWYHKTIVMPGEISITIGAEYD